MAVSIIGPKFYAWDSDTGKPLAFGKVYTYQAGTNTPKATFTTEGGETENANPVILNGAGYADIFLNGSYKVVVKDADDVEVWTSDPVSDPSQLQQEWVRQRNITQVNTTTFTVDGELTDEYVEGVAVRVKQDSGFVTGTVASATYADGKTTVTLDFPGNETITASAVYAERALVSFQSLPKNLGDRTIYVGSVAELVSLGGLSDNQQVSVSSFYSDISSAPKTFFWSSTYSKENHNGGTIVDPDHSSSPGDTGWWQADNSGSGCFLMEGADVEPLDVNWFGARKDAVVDGVSNFDSWPAFDAAFRTCFWDHVNQGVAKDALRSIKVPEGSSTVDESGYFLSESIKDTTAGWPLEDPGVVWDEDSMQSLGDSLSSVFIKIFGTENRVGTQSVSSILKAEDDYFIRNRWLRFSLKDLEVHNSTSNANYPAVLTNQKIFMDNVRFGGIGDYDYATKEGVTVNSGRVPPKIGPGVTTRDPSCFVIGIICDDDATGSIKSNCNGSRLTNMKGIDCDGTFIYLARTSNATNDTNGCYFDVAYYTGSRENGVVTIAGGYNNRVNLQLTQRAFAAVHCIGNYGQTTENYIEAGYIGDFVFEGSGASNLAPYLFLDQFNGNGDVEDNVVKTQDVNYQSGVSGSTTWMAIHPSASDIGRLKNRNGVYTRGTNIRGSTEESWSGKGQLGLLPATRTMHQDLQSGSSIREIDPDTGMYIVEYALSDLLLNGVDYSDSGDSLLKVDFYAVRQGEEEFNISTSIVGIDFYGNTTAYEIVNTIQNSNFFDIEGPTVDLANDDVTWIVYSDGSSSLRARVNISRVI